MDLDKHFANFRDLVESFASEPPSRDSGQHQVDQEITALDDSSYVYIDKGCGGEAGLTTPGQSPLHSPELQANGLSQRAQQLDQWEQELNQLADRLNRGLESLNNHRQDGELRRNEESAACQTSLAALQEMESSLLAERRDQRERQEEMDNLAREIEHTRIARQQELAQRLIEIELREDEVQNKVRRWQERCQTETSVLESRHTELEDKITAFNSAVAVADSRRSKLEASHARELRKSHREIDRKRSKLVNQQKLLRKKRARIAKEQAAVQRDRLQVQEEAARLKKTRQELRKQLAEFAAEQQAYEQTITNSRNHKTQDDRGGRPVQTASAVVDHANSLRKKDGCVGEAEESPVELSEDFLAAEKLQRNVLQQLNKLHCEKIRKRRASLWQRVLSLFKHRDSI